MTSGKEQLNSSTNANLRKRMKEEQDSHTLAMNTEKNDHRLKILKTKNKVIYILTHYIALFIYAVVFIAGFGIIHDWEWKKMIESAVSHIVVAIFSGLLTHYFIKWTKENY